MDLTGALFHRKGDLLPQSKSPFENRSLPQHVGAHGSHGRRDIALAANSQTGSKPADERPDKPGVNFGTGSKGNEFDVAFTDWSD
jgi:hypothetical protein